MYRTVFSILVTIIFNTAATVHVQAQLSPPEIRDGGNYKIRNVANKNFLTVMEQGIVGLRTGRVGTLPENHSMSQGWTLTWKPLRGSHQGYSVQSRLEYLNGVTAFYPPSRRLVEGSLNPTLALQNVWRFKYVGGHRWQIQNVRTNNCLQVWGPSKKKVKNRVNEGECLKSGAKDVSTQHWNLIRVIVVPEEEELLF